MNMFDRRKFLKIGAAATTAAVAGGVSLNTKAAKDLPIRGNKDFSPTTGKERKASRTSTQSAPRARCAPRVRRR
jgi:hypothetical protein